MALGAGWSKTWTYFEGEWQEGNVGIMGPRTHAAWLCSVVFDGARYFEGVTPDLELHCARVNDSARKLFLKPVVTTEEWVRLAREGIARFDKDAALYIRPGCIGGNKKDAGCRIHDPESTRWCLCVSLRLRCGLGQKGFSCSHCLRFDGRRWIPCPSKPKRDVYIPKTPSPLFRLIPGASTTLSFWIWWETSPNSPLLMCSLAKVWRCIHTDSEWNFSGRHYAAQAGHRIVEGSGRGRNRKNSHRHQDFEAADEIFSTGNYSKVVPVTKIGDRALPFGPLYT